MSPWEAIAELGGWVIFAILALLSILVLSLLLKLVQAILFTSPKDLTRRKKDRKLPPVE